MTGTFSLITALVLLLAALFAHLTGLPATSYFALLLVYSGFAFWGNRKQRSQLLVVSQAN